MTSKNILPQSSREFAKKEYWDRFFSQRQKTFEWYGNYEELKPALSKSIKPQDEMLVIGCGNSALSVDMYDDGFVKNTSVDISRIVVDGMAKKYSTSQRPNLKFEVADVFNLSDYSDGRFNAVLDKGTLDALVSNEELDMNRMFDEIERVLAPMGRYVCISLLQENVLGKLLDRFARGTCNRWCVRLQHIDIEARRRVLGCLGGDEDPAASRDSSVNFPVFVATFLKLLKPLPIPPAVDFYSGDGSELVSRSSPDDIAQTIDAMQKLEFLRHYIRSGTIPRDEAATFTVPLFGSEDSENWRYLLHFAFKTPCPRAPRCALFIVPQGQEQDWIFSTPDGRTELRDQAKLDQLIVVHLSPHHSYLDYKTIQADLSPMVRGFFPSGVKDECIQFLTNGDEIAQRTIVKKLSSPLSGEMFIEDVDDTEDPKFRFRRLSFIKNRFVIQSESRYRISSKKFDHTYLPCEHHEIISASLNMTCRDKTPKKMLVIGLGGGGLISFLQTTLKPGSLNITVVEIDPVIHQVASSHFGFQDRDVRVEIADGLEFLRNTEDTYDYIVFDVDTKDTSLGISCPPPAFVTQEMLTIVHSRLEADGQFLLNLVARNRDLKAEVCDALKAQFATVIRFPIDGELNEICVAFKNKESKYSKLRDRNQRLDHLKNGRFYIKNLDSVYDKMSQKRAILL